MLLLIHAGIKVKQYKLKGPQVLLVNIVIFNMRCIGCSLGYNVVFEYFTTNEAGRRVKYVKQMLATYALYCFIKVLFHQSSASLAFVWGIHRWPLHSPHKWPVTRKMLPFDDVIVCRFIAMISKLLQRVTFVTPSEKLYIPFSLYDESSRIT